MNKIVCVCACACVHATDSYSYATGQKKGECLLRNCDQYSYYISTISIHSVCIQHINDKGRSLTSHRFKNNKGFFLLLLIICLTGSHEEKLK